MHEWHVRNAQAGKLYRRINSKSAYESWNIATVLSRSDVTGRVIRAGSQITIYAQLGGVSLSAGANNLGQLSKYYPSATIVSFGGFIGAASVIRLYANNS